MLEKVDCNGKPIPIAFHVPIGTRKIDSLDFSEITDDMWRGLASRIKRREDAFVVIENQQVGLDVILTSSKSRRIQKDRNDRLIGKLDSVGVI